VKLTRNLAEIAAACGSMHAPLVVLDEPPDAESSERHVPVIPPKASCTLPPQDGGKP
jgi:hypothetical protein